MDKVRFKVVQFNSKMDICENLHQCSINYESPGENDIWFRYYYEDYRENVCSAFGVVERFRSFAEFFGNNERFSIFFKPETLCSRFRVNERITSFTKLHRKAFTEKGVFFNDLPEKYGSVRENCSFKPDLISYLSKNSMQIKSYNNTQCKRSFESNSRAKDLPEKYGSVKKNFSFKSDLISYTSKNSMQFKFNDDAIPTVSSSKTMKPSQIDSNESATPMTSVSKISVENYPLKNESLGKNFAKSSQNSNLNVATNANSKSGESLTTDLVSRIMKEMNETYGTVKVTAANNKNLSFPSEKERKIPSRASLGVANFNGNFDNKMLKSVNSQNELKRKMHIMENCEFCLTKSPTSKENEKLCDECYSKTRGNKVATSNEVAALYSNKVATSNEVAALYSNKAATSNDDCMMSYKYNFLETAFKVKKVKHDRSRKRDSSIMSRAKKVMPKREIDILKHASSNRKEYHHMKSFTDP